MRIQIKFDSADTAQVRKIAVALHRAGHTAELQVGVEGPECWGGQTPMLTEAEFYDMMESLPDPWKRAD